MRVVITPEEMQAFSAAAARAGRRIGFVPTMGFLHEGHLSLVRAARAASDVVVMSIFVNPLQFGPHEDFDRYPRDPLRDQALAEGAGVDLLWMPPTEAMYPAPPQVTVAPGAVASILEGAVRPDHFAGVLTVLLKLFAIVQPTVAVFGRKDAQQAALVRFMVRDFNLPVTVVVAPLVRDTDGLALSSRNVYLNAGARERALALPRALGAGVGAFRAGERRAGSVIAATWKVLGEVEGVTTEYINVIDPDTFLPSHAATARSYLAAAIRVGPTRLIDNVILGDGLEGDARR
jgi:pantoate--beta-alanine ligase